MKPTLTLVLLSTMVTMTFGQVTADYDENVDFSKYKTYTFAGWQKDSDEQLNDFDKERILTAFKNEFASRGLTANDADPDMKITLFIVVREETSTTAYTNYTGGLGYGGRRWGWGMGSAHTTYTTDDYLAGTMVIDCYDEDTKELLWQGVMKTVVKEKPKKREKSIPKNINKLMKKYPIKEVKN